MSEVFVNINRCSRRARKAHRCLWCGGGIPKGSDYTQLTDEVTYHFHISRFHPECAEAVETHSKENAEYEPFENLRPT